MLRQYGAKHLLFLTLTFGSPVTSTTVAHGKLNSLLNRIRERYLAYLWVMEPQASGNLHYHMLLATRVDAHAGTYVRGFERRLGWSTDLKRQHMSPALCCEADWITNKAQRHGFGRTEVAPIYSEDPIAVVRYMMKQDWRSRPWPFDETKYVRFWSCSKNVRAGNNKFCWVGEKPRAFRSQLRQWALEALCVPEHNGEQIRELEETGFGELAKLFGPTWFLKFRAWLYCGPDDGLNFGPA